MRAVTLIISATVLFCYGFISGKTQIFPYEQIKTVYLVLKQPFSNIDGFEDCEIPTINEVPKGSIAIIGHAYGAHAKASLFDSLAENVEKFLVENSGNLNRVIFSGDVFSAPSLQKWKKLENDFGNEFKIDIAPGNHDVESPASFEVFTMSAFGKSQFPYIIELENSTLIIENSVETKWEASLDTLSFLNAKSKKDNIVIRHHIPIQELSVFANASTDKKLSTFGELSKNIHNRGNITWIIGDSGAWHHLPRLKCLRRDNHIFILNGIGEVPGDQIILMHEEKLFSFIL